MIIPCIDLMDGKVVQLVQGREKALEAEGPLAMVEKFKDFPEIQVIDLDAAMGRGSNDELVKLVASHAVTRIGGGVRSVERAQKLIEQGARKIIIGTAAFLVDGANVDFLQAVTDSIGRHRVIIALDSKDGKIVVSRDGEDAQNDFQQEMQQTYAGVAAKVAELLNTYAQQHNYTLVLDGGQQEAAVVLFASPSTDITKAIIEAYNLKSGVPAPPAQPAAAAPAPMAPSAH